MGMGLGEKVGLETVGPLTSRDKNPLTMDAIAKSKKTRKTRFPKVRLVVGFMMTTITKQGLRSIADATPLRHHYNLSRSLAQGNEGC